MFYLRIKILSVMDSGKKNTMKGGGELTPEVIESAILEILNEAGEILKMYEIDGAVISVSLGLLPNKKRKQKPVSDQGYKLSINENDDFAIAVTYKHPKFKNKEK